MLKQFSNDLLMALNQRLATVAEEETTLAKRMTSSLSTVRSSLKELRTYVIAHGFKDRDEEIYFFKYIKPNFFARQLFCIELYAIESTAPVHGYKERYKFFSEQLRYTTRFFHRHEFTYQYYKLDATELDGLYFIRGVEVQDALMPEVPDLDPEFSTGCDYLFSKFIAHEKLQLTLLQKIEELEAGEHKSTLTVTAAPEIRWTGDAINLVELAYGLWLTGQLNNGNASLNQIVRWLEGMLQVNIGIIQRRFGEIERRKRISVTRFIDQMKQVILEKIEQNNR